MRFLRVAILSLLVIAGGMLPWVTATIERPRTDACLLDVPVAGDFLAGELSIHLEEAVVTALQEDRIAVRAIGLAPRIVVTWLGSSRDPHDVEIQLENANLREGVVHVSSAAREVGRSGSTVRVSGPLLAGPLDVGVTIPPEVVARGRFVVMGCTRGNRIMGEILARVQADPPLFAIHLGDLGHGLAYECEAVRSAFDGLGVPLFASPGNHDEDQLMKRDSLASFHAFLNPAPYAFDAGKWRFAMLDGSDYPIRPAQIDWLRQEAGKVGDRELCVCLHRPPLDPRGLGRELPGKDGGDAIAAILSSTKCARMFAAHLGGYATGTFAGHPFTMSSGGGEHHVEEKGKTGPYHHLVVSLETGEEKLVTYDEPTFLQALRSRLAVEGPVFLRRPWIGALGSGLTLLLVLAVRRWRRRARA